MSGRGGQADQHIAKAVAFKLRCPDDHIPEAMLASKFTVAESQNPAKQMAVCRAYEKATSGKTKASRPNLVGLLTAGTSTVSPLTNQTISANATTSQELSLSPPSMPQTPGGLLLTRSKPMAKLMRKNSRVIQKVQINKLSKWDFAKCAVKRAKKWYAREKNKPGGLSGYQIAEKVKKEYDGVGPHPATIRCYVNANLVGMSLLKVGMKGDMPPCSFKSLCMAFESYVQIQQLNLSEGEITFKKLALRINAVLHHDYWQKMLKRVLLAKAKNLMHRQCILLKIVVFGGLLTQILQVGLTIGNGTWLNSGLR
jgi:hypothetical protein